MPNDAMQNVDIFAESGRCLGCKNPSCVKGCPVGYDIPLFLRYAAAGDFVSATQTVGHLFGEVCGYVCARDKQCKGNCVLAKRNCGIDVGSVERRVFAERFPAVIRQSNALQGIKAAVVGGGVSGITFAEQCIKHSAEVTLYEQNQLLHTLKSIPEIRLPRAALKRVEQFVADSGINVVRRKIDGAALQELRRRFDVVYLATGAMRPNLLGVSGEEFVTYADDFLRGNVFGNAIIIGGGNVAMDCALLNASKGCKTTVCYRRTRGDMPAFDAEIDSVTRSGASFFFNVAPLYVTKTKDGLAVTFAKTVTEGRGKLAVTEDIFQLKCDVLVAATGSVFDPSVYKAARFVDTDERNCVEGNLYAGGDATGKGLAVFAVADALNAFRAVFQKSKR
ncbi:MAG: FAD-dependent oxidoreductase [Corallococcus sp.]|nr:FAD-dependent oxidoreductase [Corallococcus sp.]MCM1359302.1 FAD-dependent oxidoreductase [Corallococcus sp.]MCM1394887.1 FAD-dependent oxidoreductase [Corallococcus sp.]